MSTGDVIDRAVRLYRRNFSSVIAIVAVPSLIGYFAGLAFTSGYGQLLTSVASQSSGMQGASLLLMMLGLLGYPLWFFAQVFTLTGLARVVGDNLMMGDSITFRKCFAAARRRLGDILLMTLLLFAVLIVVGVVASIILFAAFMVIGVVVGVTAAAGFPAWLGGILLTIVTLLTIAGGATLALIVGARVIFLPQALMIEGQSAGSSLGRAIRLGAGNWYRLGAIMLFTYFVTVSLLAALTIPVVLCLEWFGVSSIEFVLTPVGGAIYSAFNQIANLLSLPIWVISFTILYFDNRVRKEGYDLELLARDVAPGFYWQTPQYQPQQAYAGAYPAATGQPHRVFMQTGPLGLGGYAPPRVSTPAIAASEPLPMQSSPAETVASTGPFPDQPAPLEIVTPEPGDEPEPAEDKPAIFGASELEQPSVVSCGNCGVEVPDNARFCIRCGTEL